MHSDIFKTPVLILIFNRPDATQKVFNEIKKIRPQKLFIAGDGPRIRKGQAESEKVSQARKIVEQNIDWECEVKTLYRDENLGCQQAVVGALDWFFNSVEEGIILEDDCVPHRDFFRFCEELLERYRVNEKIMHISGDNFQQGIIRGGGSYYFSLFPHCWGWATWKRAWQRFDLTMKTFPEFKKQDCIQALFDTSKERWYWLSNFNEMYQGKLPTVWDFAWTYACWYYKGLTCIPNVNLVTNIGFETTATHTIINRENVALLPTQALFFPLRHPPVIERSKEADEYTNIHHFKIGYKKLLLRYILKKFGLYEIVRKIILRIKSN